MAPETPEGAARCPECGGRGRNFDAKKLSLDVCNTCQGLGYTTTLDQELEEFLAEYGPAAEEK